LRRIHAAIVVEKEGHKAIIIGSGGSKMKQIATAARLDMEKLFGGKVLSGSLGQGARRWTQDEAGLRGWAMVSAPGRESREAFILHGYAYRETSLLIEVFTRPFGRVSMGREGTQPALPPARVLLAFQPPPCPGSARANCARSRARSGVGGQTAASR